MSKSILIRFRLPTKLLWAVGKNSNLNSDSMLILFSILGNLSDSFIICLFGDTKRVNVFLDKDKCRL